MKAFSQLRFYFPGDSSLHQVDKKLTSPVTLNDLGSPSIICLDSALKGSCKPPLKPPNVSSAQRPEVLEPEHPDVPLVLGAEMVLEGA